MVLLTQFNIKSIPKGSVCLILGRRRAGKTTLVKDILYHNQDHDINLAITFDKIQSAPYETIIPPIHTYISINDELIGNLVKRQKELVKMNKPTYRAPFLILDSCFVDDTSINSKNMDYLFQNTKNQEMMFVITMQYLMKLNKSDLVDYVFILNETSDDNLKRIFDTFGSLFSTFEEFCETVKSYTNDYSCVVIDRQNGGAFFYKDEIHEPFKVGAQEFWK